MEALVAQRLAEPAQVPSPAVELVAQLEAGRTDTADAAGTADLVEYTADSGSAAFGLADNLELDTASSQSAVDR